MNTKQNTVQNIIIESKMCLLYNWENIGDQNKKTLKKQTKNTMSTLKKRWKKMAGMNESYGEYGKSYEDEKPKGVLES